MFEINYIRHDQITSDLLTEIIQVKNMAWPYSYESQIAWIRANLKDADLHVLLRKDKQVIAYLNLIEIMIKIDSIAYNAYGIGNVCALEKGKGWGREIVQQSNKFIKENNKVGLLFCRDKSLNFYKSVDWSIIENRKLNIKFKNNVHTLIFNFDAPFHIIDYSGIAF